MDIQSVRSTQEHAILRVARELLLGSLQCGVQAYRHCCQVQNIFGCHDVVYFNDCDILAVFGDRCKAVLCSPISLVADANSVNPSPVYAMRWFHVRWWVPGVWCDADTAHARLIQLPFSCDVASVLIHVRRVGAQFYGYEKEHNMALMQFPHLPHTSIIDSNRST